MRSLATSYTRSSRLAPHYMSQVTGLTLDGTHTLIFSAAQLHTLTTKAGRSCPELCRADQATVCRTTHLSLEGCACCYAVLISSGSTSLGVF